METKKKFDCLEMKKIIQQKINKETKDMSPKELLLYFNGNKNTNKINVQKSKKLVRV